MIKKIGLFCSVGSAICTILGLFVKDNSIKGVSNEF